MQVMIFFFDILFEFFLIFLGGFEFVLCWYVMVYIVGIILVFQIFLMVLWCVYLWCNDMVFMDDV